MFMRNGKRVELVNQCHYVHWGEGDVWEALELLIRTGKGEEVAREETKETKRTIIEKTKS
jgi:hypothetical protein